MLNYLNLYCEFPGFLQLCSIVLFTGGNTAHKQDTEMFPFLVGHHSNEQTRTSAMNQSVGEDVDLCVSIICLTS